MYQCATIIKKNVSDEKHSAIRWPIHSTFVQNVLNIDNLNYSPEFVTNHSKASKVDWVNHLTSNVVQSNGGGKNALSNAK
jgi:hypothetical protein